MSLILCLLVSHQIYAADYRVIAFGKHEVDHLIGKKTAIYTYKLENFSNDEVGVFAVGDSGDETPPYLDTRNARVLETGFIVPPGWKAERIWLEESYSYYLQWIVLNHNDLFSGKYYLLPGQSSDRFSVRLNRADPNYVTTKAIVQDKLVNIVKADTAAPTAEIYLTTLPAAGKPGWLEVSVTAAAHDDMDPYPDVLLSKITANQTFPATDVQAVFNEETKKFLVKIAKDRIYNVTFTVMDASGNTSNYTKSLSVNTRRVHLGR
ncbi:hypothetical protein [Undibacterium sp. SXout20W]|uniref:hypothetical protein n=1 Tax=Undibacterium sp. SXout20W TaxID=3413051 RepID=UPI003BF3F016